MLTLNKNTANKAESGFRRKSELIDNELQTSTLKGDKNIHIDDFYMST